MQSPGISQTDLDLLTIPRYRYQHRFVDEASKELVFQESEDDNGGMLPRLYFRWQDSLFCHSESTRFQIYRSFLNHFIQDNDDSILVAARLLCSALDNQPYLLPHQGGERDLTTVVFMDLHEKMMQADYVLSFQELVVYRRHLDFARHNSIYRNVTRTGGWTVRDLMSLAADCVPEQAENSATCSRHKLECMAQLLRGDFFQGATLACYEYPEMITCFTDPYAKSFYRLLTETKTSWDVAQFLISNQSPHAAFRCRWSRTMFFCAALYALSSSSSSSLTGGQSRVHGFFDVLGDVLSEYATKFLDEPYEDGNDALCRSCLLIYEEIRHVYTQTLALVSHFDIPIQVIQTALDCLHPIVHESRFGMSLTHPGPNPMTLERLFEDILPKIRSLKHESLRSYVSTLYKTFPQYTRKYLMKDKHLGNVLNSVCEDYGGINSM